MIKGKENGKSHGNGKAVPKSVRIKNYWLLLSCFCFSLIFLFVMNSLIWNVRDISNSASLARVRSLCSSLKLNCLTLIEPLVDISQCATYWLRLGFDKYSSTTNGKLWLFSHSSLSTDMVYITDQLLHVSCNGMGSDCIYCTFFMLDVLKLSINISGMILSLFLLTVLVPGSLVVILMLFSLLVNTYVLFPHPSLAENLLIWLMLVGYVMFLSLVASILGVAAPYPSTGKD